MDVSVEEFLDEDWLTYISESISLLRPVAEKVLEIHFEGLQRERVIELLDAVKDFLEYKLRVAGIEDSVLLKRLKDVRDFISSLPSLPIQIRPRGRIRDLAELLESMPSLPRPGLLLPKPKDIARTLKELDELIDLLIFDFHTHVNTLTKLFDVIKPEAIPWLVKFISKNPGYVRTVLGEPLFIWWFSRTLSKRGDKSYWSNAKGPFTTGNAEIDVASIICRKNVCEYAVAEVELSRGLKRLEVEGVEKAIKQVMRAVTALKQVSNVRVITTQCRSENVSECICREVAIATLYNIKDVKDRLKERLEAGVRKNNLECNVEVYDINDVLENLHGLREDVKSKYRELLLTINKIIETT
jgi:hypothetical protein